MALVNGAEKRDSIEVAVTPRSWPNEFPKHAVETECTVPGSAGCPLDYPPVHERDLGQTVLEPSSFRIKGLFASQGPNHGFYYIEEAPIKINAFRTYLNPVLFDGRDKFYERSECPQPQLLAHVRAHEAKHLQFYLEREPGTTINGPLEKLLMRTTYDVFADSAKELTQTLVKAILVMLANENEMLANDPRRLEFPKAPCKIGLKPNR
jgi:hypothetical protein